MAIPFLVPINLNKLELQNAVIQVLGSDPSSPVEGQVYYNSSSKKLRQYNGTTWVEYGTGTGTGDVTQASNSGGAGRMKVSAGADKSIADLSGVVGIVKTDTNGVVSAAASGTDYAPATSGSAILKGNGAGGFSAAVADVDYATPSYVDIAVTGLKWKDSVRVATIAAGTLASSFENGDSVDGVALATGDRILIKDQAAGAENGIYVVNASGAPTRATDADTAAEIKGMVVAVREGSLADTAWILTNDTITLGTTALVYTNFITANVPSASTTVQGKVELATQAETEAKSDTVRAVTPASLATFTRKVTATIGDGVTTAIAVTDNLGSVDKIALLRAASGETVAYTDITYATNTTTFTFAVAPASNAYDVVIIG